METAWSHNVLSRDLHQKRQARTATSAWWEVDIPLPTGGRADVLEVHWDDRHRVGHWTIFEVKASIPDFEQDAADGKWHRYEGGCDFLYFAAPLGLITPTRLPEGAGLIERGKRSWRIKQKAVRSSRVVSDLEWFQKLAMREHWRRPLPDDQVRLERMRRFAEMVDLSPIIDGRVKARITEIMHRQHDLGLRADALNRREAILAGREQAMADWDQVASAVRVVHDWAEAVASGAGMNPWHARRLIEALRPITESLASALEQE